MSAPSYVPVTNISQIEKIYCNSYNHDVKAPVVYANDNRHLYADAEFTKPVDYKLLKDLFFAGVIVCGGKYFDRPILCYEITNPNPTETFGDDIRLFDGASNFYGYDIERNQWANYMPS